MKTARFEEIVEKRTEKCLETLYSKNAEYTQAETSDVEDDRLSQFKVAAALQGCSPITALAGMMAKHTASVYDLVQKQASGYYVSPEMWAEKIGDNINYLLLLTALVAEEQDLRMCAEANCNTERG